MKIQQKKFSTVHTFEFKEKHFNFAYQDKTGSGDVDVAYTSLPLKTSSRIEDNSWWRNVGYLWCCLGVLSIGSGLVSGDGIAGRGFWLIAGLCCLAVYRVTRVTYTTLAINGGNIFIIQDGKTHDRVLKELMDRRKAQWLALCGEIDLDSNLENERSKFEFLKEQGVLSEDEAAAKIRQATAVFGASAELPRTLN